MQTETWFKLVEQQFPENADTVDYLRREGERQVATNSAISFGRHQAVKERRSNGDEREFLESLGHKRKPVTSKATKIKPETARYKRPL